MKTVNDDDEVEAKYGIMIKDLGLKTYCTQEAIDNPLIGQDEPTDACS